MATPSKKHGSEWCFLAVFFCLKGGKYLSEVGETLEFILEFMCETDIRVLTSNDGGVGVGTCFFFEVSLLRWDGFFYSYNISI